MENRSEKNTAINAETSVDSVCGYGCQKCTYGSERSWSDNPQLEERKLHSMSVHMVENSGYSLTLRGNGSLAWGL